jgi:hypothetical protein
MLSDSLFEVRQKLLREINHYSEPPFEADYPKSQELNLTLALYHLQLAQMAYDSFGCRDDHEFNTEEKLKAMTRAKKEFYDAVNNMDSDSD